MDKLKECKKLKCGFKCPNDVWCNIERVMTLSDIYSITDFALDKDIRIYTKSMLEDNIYNRLKSEVIFYCRS